MTQFKTNENNDLYLDTNNDLAIISGEFDLVQSIEAAIRLWLKEYEYNTSIGVNYKQIYGNPNLLPEVIDYNLTTAIMSVNTFLTPDNLKNYGIKKINSLDYKLNRDTRVMQVTGEILLNNNTTKQIGITI